MKNETRALPQQDMATDCFLAASPCIYMHVHTLLTNKDVYLATLHSMCQSGVFGTLSQAIKTRTIAALHLTGQHQPLQQLLTHCQVVEIVKALLFLDQRRRIRQLDRQIKAIQDSHPHLKMDDGQAKRAESKSRKAQTEEGDTTKPRKRRKRKIDGLRRELAKLQHPKGDALHTATTHSACAVAHANSAAHELIESASVSGALARKIRQWAKRHLAKDSLEFIVLTMPMNHWKKLANLVHFSPSDFSLSYFLSAVHGDPLPEGSFVQGLHNLVKTENDQLAAQYLAFAREHPQIYLAFNYLRTQSRLLRVREIATDLAQGIPLSTAIWYLEELTQSSGEIPEIVGHRLRTENWMAEEESKVTASFGKLLERLLTFQSRSWSMLVDPLMVAAERRLSALQEMCSNQQQKSDDCATVVLGDASSSMQSAIEAATILSTMISVCWGAELCFFNHDFVVSPHSRPSTVQETMKVCQTIRASGATSLAAALWPYYEQKRKIDRIVLVTDEEENTASHGFMFAPLLQAYKEQVHTDVALIVICVDSGNRRFRSSLVDCGIDCKRIEIDGRRPDLTKFDAMLGQIALSSSSSGQPLAKKDNHPGDEDEFVVV